MSKRLTIHSATTAAVLGARDPGGLVDVLLAESRAVTHPAEAMVVRFRLVDEVVDWLAQLEDEAFGQAERYIDLRAEEGVHSR